MFQHDLLVTLYRRRSYKPQNKHPYVKLLDSSLRMCIYSI